LKTVHPFHSSYHKVTRFSHPALLSGDVDIIVNKNKCVLLKQNDGGLASGMASVCMFVELFKVGWLVCRN